nr:TNF receptor-associated factor 3-like [Lytechinus pictus]
MQFKDGATPIDIKPIHFECLIINVTILTFIIPSAFNLKSHLNHQVQPKRTSTFNFKINKSRQGFLSSSMAEKGSEVIPSIKSLQSDTGESEAQPGSVGSFQGASPPPSYLELPGYPRTIFKNAPSDNYLCGICNQVARWPVQTDCACGLFCHGCLQRYIGDETGTLECPRCQETFPVNEIQRDKVAHKKLLKLDIECPHGCGTEMLLRDLDKHEEECQFVIIECINKQQGCKALIKRIDLVNHLEKQCDFRKVSCQHCRNQFLARELEEHEKDCAFTESVTKVLTDKGADEETEAATGKLVTHDLMKTVAIKLEAKIAEVRRMMTEIENQGKVLKSLFEDSRVSINRNQDALVDVDKSVKQLQKMVLTKLSKLPDMERSIGASLSRTEFETHKDSIHEMRDDVDRQNTRLSTLEEQSKSGVLGSTEGVPKHLKDKIANNTERVQYFDEQISMYSMRLAEHELRFQFQETASYDGTLIWKIKEFARRKRDADNGKTLSLYSQPFYTSRFGYKMCARIYLNGDGIGKGTHVSLFFVVMKGDYDALIPWPFSQKVTLMLLDQETGRRHLSDSFRPDPTSTSFQRPSTNMNIASGCPLFVSQSVLKDPAYVKEDTIFIKVVVDTTDLYGP